MGKIGRLLKRLVDDGAAERTVELLLLSHTDEVAGLVAIATGKSEDFVGSSRGDDGLQLAIAVWEVHAPSCGGCCRCSRGLAAKVSLSVGLTPPAPDRTRAHRAMDLHADRRQRRLKAIERAERDQLRQRIVAARVATAEPKGHEQFLKQLDAP